MSFSGDAGIGSGQIHFCPQKLPGDDTLFQFHVGPLGISKNQRRHAMPGCTLAHVPITSMDIIAGRQGHAKDERNDLLVGKHQTVRFHEIFD